MMIMLIYSNSNLDKDGAKITGGQRFVYNVTKGTNVPIECNARGQPAPKIELFIDNRSVIIHFTLLKTGI